MDRVNGMKRCVIIGGANINKYEVIRTFLKPDDFIVCCDSGLKHLDGLGIRADFVIGDFDSHADPHLSVETVILPREKDDTDSMAAVREMTARGFEDFLLIGVFGDRLDHTLGNVYILLWLNNRKLKAMAVDDFSEMEIVSPHSPAKVSSSYPYFSLLAINGSAEGITIKNAKYPLEQGVITAEYQYGLSNEPLEGKTAEVSLEKGNLLLIRDR